MGLGPLSGYALVMYDSHPTQALGWYTKGAGYCVPLFFQSRKDAERVATALVVSGHNWVVTEHPPAGHGYYETDDGAHVTDLP